MANRDRTIFAPNVTAPDEAVLNNGIDLKPDNRKKLGQYLSNRTSNVTPDQDTFMATDYQTVGRANDFPIDGTTHEEISYRADGNRNYNLPETSSAQATFADKNSVDRWSKSRDGESVGWKSVTQVERAGGEKGKRRVLSELPGSGETTQVNEYSEKLKDGIKSVLNHNAFTQDRNFTSRTVDPETPPPAWPAADSNQKIAEMRAAAERVLGYSSGRKGPDGTDFGPLARVGQSINLAPESVKKGITGFRYASGSNYSSFDDQPIVAGPSDEGFVGVPLQYVGANNIDIPYPDDGLGNTGGIYSGFSYGNKNDSDTPFGNIAKGAESILFALAAAVAIFVAITVWSLVLTVIFFKLDRPEYRTGVNPPGYERDTSFASDLLGMFFGTKRPYTISTLEAGFDGVVSFLGVDIVGPAAVPLIEAAINFAFSPDYYLIICRMVLNGVYSFVGQSTGGGSPGPAGAVAAIANLRTNKLVSFVNRMIDIGSISARGVDTTSDTDAAAGAENYDQQAIKRVARSRQVGNKLAWRSTATAMAILKPDVIINGSAALYKPNPNFANIWADRIAKRVPSALDDKIGSTTEITSQQANEVEKHLNAEYVPFYFRDLRTNEIISFHAFLADLSDSFAASYTAVEGFGRQDPVQMYKSTTRSIGFSFHIVSTSPKDHDVMWYKINKLITMLYPQYTDGIEVKGSGDKSNLNFEVPFSQVYGASPLIRIRIGDVISSNYSRFGLARLFGLGKTSRKFSQSGSDIDQDNVGAYEGIFNGDFTTSADSEKAIDQIQQETSAADAAALLGLNTTKGRVIRGGIFRGLKNKALGLLEKTYSVHIRPGTTVTLSSPPTPSKNIFIDTSLTPGAVGNKVASLVQLSPPITVRPKGSTENVAINYAYIPYEYLEFTSVGSGVGSVFSVPPVQPPEDEVSKFFSPANNTIVQSFESSMGMGLAGVITSLSMDWNEATWETDKQGGKAPIWLKVTMQFAPIHDLPMGIDSTGVQIAPAYPVGDLVRGMHGIQVDRGDGSFKAGYNAQDSDGAESDINFRSSSPNDTPAPGYKKRFI